MSGELWFSWRTIDGRIVNWWSSDVVRDPKRFVHHEWGRFVVAIDLRAREAQIQFNFPSEWRTIRFEDIEDESARYAIEAICDTRNVAFGAELLMRIIDRDDLADAIARRSR